MFDIDLDLGLNGPLTWWRCLGLFSSDAFWCYARRGLLVGICSQYVSFYLMTNHLHLVLIQNRVVLEQLSMVFGKFYNVLYLSNVILVLSET
jgi:chromosome condensin MukBEF MukE localization factor